MQDSPTIGAAAFHCALVRFSCCDMTSRLLSVLVFVLGQLGCGGRSALDAYAQSGGAGNAATTGGSRATGGTTATGNVISAIAAGCTHTCVVVDGEVRCWGFNVDGELGNGTIRLGIL